jgi:subtilase family serine protease
MELFRSSRRPTPRPFARQLRLRLEALEDRTLLSGFAGAFARPGYVIYHPAQTATPFGSPGATGTTPTQIRHAYGFDQITFPGNVKGDGSGTTIAIVDAYDDPNVANDLQQFDANFGLPNPTFTKVNQSGGTSMPAADSGWASEIALDVEWAHAIAPGANILLVEANDSSYTNLFAAVTYAAKQPGVVAVSMSWGGGEFSGENGYDSTFTTPGGHGGVTFLAASGDSGAPASYPPASPNELSVGGTTLNVDGSGNILSESGWSGSGGGLSAVESQPPYQNGVVTQSSTSRATPDVAYDADPNTGFPVYDSYNNGTAAPWSQFGGTSDAAPQWAGLIAIADQGRALAGLGSLDGASQTLPMLYKHQADFHDITSGSSTGSPTETAGPGYDLVTGLGTPIANKLVADLVGAASVTHFSVSAPAASTAGSAFSVTVTALDQNNHTVTGYGGTIHFSSSDVAAGLPANYTFTGTDNGVHTFTNLVTLKTAGNQAVSVNDAAATTITGSATVSVTAASANHLGFGQQPSNTVAGSSISPAVTVRVLDAYNNLVTTDSSDTVTVAIGTNAGSGTLSGTTSAKVSGGVASFSNLSINKTGTGYTFKATSGSLGSGTSSAFNITPGTATQLSFGQQPTNTPAGSTINPAITVQILDADGNLVSGDNTDAVTIALGSNPGSGTLSGTLKITAKNGTATFSDLAISKAGNGYTLTVSSGTLKGTTSNTFNVTPAGTHLFFSQQPTSVAAGASIAPAVTVEVLDFNNNVVTTDNSDKITLAISANPGGGTLSGTTSLTVSSGIATFSGLSINKTGTGYTLQATSGALTAATSSPFNVTPGKADHLGFSQQPSNTVAGSAISPAVTVQVLDANGNLVTTDNTDSITVAIGTNAGGGALSGTTTLTVSGGTASYGTLSINKTGTGYTLKATSGTLTSATSGTFNITPGKADHLAFLQQPSNTAAGIAIAPAVTVQVLDANGNVLTGDSTESVTLTLSSNPTGASLTGGSAVTVSGGTARFSGLSVNLVGNGYTLLASSGSLKTATSASFNVTSASTLIEGFENGGGLYYASGLGNVYAYIASYAAHDGNYGLDMFYSSDWVYRKDAAAQVKQGETISLWMQFSTYVDGRAYFGFGASDFGTLSVVLAGNTGQFIIQDNSNWGFTNLAAVNQGYSPNQWYRVSVIWGTGGSITAQLYASDGKTLVNTVTATDNNITSGGIAFRATADDKFFDTVTMSPSGTGHVVQVGDGTSPVYPPSVSGFDGADGGRSQTSGQTATTPTSAGSESLTPSTISFTRGGADALVQTRAVAAVAQTPTAADARVLLFGLPAATSSSFSDSARVNLSAVSQRATRESTTPAVPSAPARQESGTTSDEARAIRQDQVDQLPADTTPLPASSPATSDDGMTEAFLPGGQRRLATDAYFGAMGLSAQDQGEAMAPVEHLAVLPQAGMGGGAAVAALLLSLSEREEFRAQENGRRRRWR